MNIFVFSLPEQLATTTQDSFWYNLPDSAQLRNGKPFFIPDFVKDCRLGLYLAVRIARLGKSISPRFATRYYDALSLAAHFYDQKGLTKAQSLGVPWSASTGFDGSIALGDFMPIDSCTLDSLSYAYAINDHQYLEATAQSLQQRITRGISSISLYNTLRNGDLLLFPLASHPESIGLNLRLSASINHRPLLHFNIK